MKEALKLALEALEQMTKPRPSFEAHKNAITAIKEALAQPEQEPVGLIESLKIAQPCCGEYETCWRPCTPRGMFLGQRDAQRTWVGLTDDEIDQGLLRSDYAFKTAEAWRAGVVFAMTKLKEKNT